MRKEVEKSAKNQTKKGKENMKPSKKDQKGKDRKQNYQKGLL